MMQPVFATSSSFIGGSANSSSCGTVMCLCNVLLSGVEPGRTFFRRLGSSLVSYGCKTANLPVGDWWFMYCTCISSWEKGISLECLVLPCNSTIPSHSQLIYGSMLASSCVLQTHHTSIDPQGLIRKNQPLFGQGVTKKNQTKNWIQRYSKDNGTPKTYYGHLVFPSFPFGWRPATWNFLPMLGKPMPATWIRQNTQAIRQLLFDLVTRPPN